MVMASSCCVMTAYAQSPALTFEYDNAGNRIKRFDPPGKTEIIAMPNVPSSISTALFPNPTTDFVTIRASEEIIAGILTINSISGQQVGNQDFLGRETLLSLQNLPTGIYFVHLEAQNYEETWKVIKK